MAALTALIMINILHDISLYFLRGCRGFSVIAEFFFSKRDDTKPLNLRPLISADGEKTERRKLADTKKFRLLPIPQN